MKTLKKYSAPLIPVISFCVSIYFITVVFAADDSFGMTSPSFGQSAWFVPSLIITILIAVSSFLLIFFSKVCRSNRKKSAGGRVNSRWFIGMAGQDNESTKRQIVQLYDI